MPPFWLTGKGAYFFLYNRKLRSCYIEKLRRDVHSCDVARATRRRRRILKSRILSYIIIGICILFQEYRTSSGKKTENTNDLSENLAIWNNDRIHRVILRLKADITVLLIKGLNSSGILHQRDDHLAVARGRLLLN